MNTATTGYLDIITNAINALDTYLINSLYDSLLKSIIILSMSVVLWVIILSVKRLFSKKLNEKKASGILIGLLSAILVLTITTSFIQRSITYRHSLTNVYISVTNRTSGVNTTYKNCRDTAGKKICDQLDFYLPTFERRGLVVDSDTTVEDVIDASRYYLFNHIDLT